MQSVWKRAMAASRLKEEAAEAAASGGGGDDDDELQFVSSSAGFKKREAPAKGKPGACRRAARQPRRRSRAHEVYARPTNQPTQPRASSTSVICAQGASAPRTRRPSPSTTAMTSSRRWSRSRRHGEGPPSAAGKTARVSAGRARARAAERAACAQPSRCRGRAPAACRPLMPPPHPPPPPLRADADFERLMKELNDPHAAASKGKSGAGKRGGKAGAAAAVDAAAGEAGDAAGGGSAAPSSSLLASTTQRLASLVERSKAAHKLAAAAQAGELPDDVAAAGGSAAAAAAAADDGSEPARPSPSSKPGKAAPAPAAAAAAAHAARGSAAAAAAPASAAGAPADAAEKRVVVLTVSMKGSKPEEYPQLTLKLVRGGGGAGGGGGIGARCCGARRVRALCTPGAQPACTRAPTPMIPSAEPKTGQGNRLHAKTLPSQGA